MHLNTHIRFDRRGRMALAAVGLTAIVTPLAATAASAGSTAPKPSAGAIQVFGVSTSLSETPPITFLITGAFSDHGIGHKGTLDLAHGTITLNTSKITAITNSPNFGTFNLASCSYSGTAKAPVTIVSGTGAYVGIRGTLVATATFGAQGSLLANGKCNEANNAPAVAQEELITASGTVSF